MQYFIESFLLLLGLAIPLNAVSTQKPATIKHPHYGKRVIKSIKADVDGSLRITLEPLKLCNEYQAFDHVTIPNTKTIDIIPFLKQATRRYILPWTAHGIDVLRSSKTVKEKPLLDNALALTSMSMQVADDVLNIMSKDIAIFWRLLIAGSILAMQWSQPNMRTTPLQRKFKKLSKSILRIYERNGNVKKLSKDLEYKGNLQDFLLHLIPSLFDSCNITITSPQTARLIKLLLTSQNIIFTYKVILPMVLLYKYFGVIMPEMKSYILYTMMSHGIRHGIQQLVQKTEEQTINEINNISSKEVAPLVNVLQDVDIDGLVTELMQEYENESDKDASSSEQYHFAITIYRDASRLLFKDSFLAEEYPKEIVSLADVYEIMQLNKEKLIRLRKIRAIFE